MRVNAIALSAAALIWGGIPATAVAASVAQKAGCDRACLLTKMSEFVKLAQAHDFRSLPLEAGAEVRENTISIDLASSVWSKLKAVKSAMTFADPVTGNVVNRAGVEMADGRAAYISTRLKIDTAGKISDVEISADTSNRVVQSYVWNLDPAFDRPLPPEKRVSRLEMNALIMRYFNSLSSHVAVSEDFGDGCNRFHSGQQITNVTTNSVEGGPPRTCASSVDGPKPWAPAVEQRVPIIDEERGIIMALTQLWYLKGPKPSAMYVSEVFKVVGGKIVKIDNIGLMGEGGDTQGFVH